MKYEDLPEPFAAGLIPNGYFGDWQLVEFCLIQGIFGKVTVVKTPSGFFRYSTPPAVDEREAAWLLRHHPTAKQIKFLSFTNESDPAVIH